MSRKVAAKTATKTAAVAAGTAVTPIVGLVLLLLVLAVAMVAVPVKAVIAVLYNSPYLTELRKVYDRIYLVRNEREFHIYSFEDGERFEPDYVLFLQSDKTEAVPTTVYVDDNDYKIWGLHFFNQENRMKEFDSEFMNLIGIE